MKRGTMLTIYGETDGSSTTGNFTLKNEWFASDQTYIRIDKNLVAKVWAIEVSGNPVDVKIEFTHDVTVGSPTWQTLKVVSLPSSGEISLDKRKPIITITGKTGNEAIRFSWSQSTAAKSYLTVVIEFTEVQ